MGGVPGVVVRSIAEVSSVMKRTDCSHRLLLGVACSRSRRVIDADHAELGGYRFEIGAWRISEGRDSLNARPNTRNRRTLHVPSTSAPE